MLFLWAGLLWAGLAAANTEKIVFSSPAPLALPPHRLDDLRLDVIRPAQLFRTDLLRNGSEHWFLLDDLVASKYELRVCWPATAPSAFEMHQHTFDEVMSTPMLLSSLAQHAERARPQHHTIGDHFMFLQIRASADYFTTDKTLMDSPPPVTVDLILDELLYGVLPRSLLPNIAYIACIGVLGWFVSAVYVRWLDAGVNHIGRKND